MNREVISKRDFYANHCLPIIKSIVIDVSTSTLDRNSKDKFIGYLS